MRDSLLGKQDQGIEHDWLVIGSTPEEMVSLGYQPVGKAFPVFLHPETKEEYALARTEKKIARGYKGFSFYTSPEVTLEQDMVRRDLTINAIAEDKDGNLIDPYKGQEDIKNKILRHVSPAFVEDPLRVLRTARFAAQLGFCIAPETIGLMRKISFSKELETLAPERIWNEFMRALGSAYPARFILALRSCHALKILFPEIDRLFGVPQAKQHHPEIDTGIHTLMALNQATQLSDNTRVRFATLLHDLGKGTTPKAKLPSHHGHEERGVKLIQAFCNRYHVPEKFRQIAVKVSRYHLDCHRAKDLRPDTLLRKLEGLDAFRQPEILEQFLLCCEADARGRSGFEKHDYPQANIFRQAFEAAKQVDPKNFVKQGYKGKDIAEAIRKERVNVIKNLNI